MTDKMGKMDFTSEEKITGTVYGETFSLYDQKELEEVIAPIKERFLRNKIDLSVFEGKRCLDLGCGSGRGTLFMLRHGAAHVCSVDIDLRLVDTTRKWVAEYGYDNVEVQLGSALDILYEDESFDIVFCNGVLHRTAEPDKGLCEIVRVLKLDGRMFLYFLGSGGVSFHLIDWVRSVLKGIDVSQALALMHLSGMDKMDLACHADDWFNSFFKRATAKDLQTRLRELGFEDVELLRGGTAYDSSRKLASADEALRSYLGEGDLRFFCTKARREISHEHILPNVEETGSRYVVSPAVMRYSKLYEEIEQELERIAPMPDGVFTRLWIMHRINGELRSHLDAGDEFDGDEYYKFLEKIIDELKAVERDHSTR